MNRSIFINIYSKKIRIAILLFFIFIISISFSAYFRVHFSNDDYIQEALPITDFAAQASSQGRPLLSLMIIIADAFNRNVVTQQLYIWPFAVVAYCFGLFFLYRTLSRRFAFTNKMSLFLLISTPMLLTTWGMVDLLTYSSMNLTYSLAFLSCMMAVYFLIKFDLRKFYILSFILLVCSLFFYQGFISFFVPIALLSLYINFGYTKKMLKKVLIAVFFYALAYAFDWGWINLIHPHLPILGQWIDSRTASPDIFKNINAVFVGLMDVFSGYHLLPKYIFPSFALLTVFMPLFFSSMVNGFKVRLILQNCFFVGVIIIFASIPHVFTSSVSYSLRSVIAIASIPILLSILNIFEYHKSLQGKSIGKSLNNSTYYPVIVIFIIMALYNILSFYNIQKFGSDIVSLNKIDMVIANQFFNEIKIEEKATGKKIENVYFINDSNPTGCYNGVVSCGNGTLYSKAFAVSWSNIFPLNKVSHRNWPVIMPIASEKYKNIFQGKNWDSINIKEQIYFDGNNAVIAVF